MPTTSRLSIPYPAGSDPVDVNGDLQSVAEALDDAALADQGLLSARPAAGTMGRLYRATDNGKVYWDTGSAWVAAGAATATADLDDAAVTAAKLADGAATSAKIAPTILHAAATNDLTITDPLTDVPGATLTFTPAVASRLLITAVFDIRIERNVFTYGEFCRTAGRIILDGSTTGTYARFAVENDGSQTPRVDAEACVACQSVVNVTAASHTVKLQAELEAGPWTGIATARSGHTALSILIVSQ